MYVRLFCALLVMGSPGPFRTWLARALGAPVAGNARDRNVTPRPDGPGASAAAAGLEAREHPMSPAEDRTVAISGLAEPALVAVGAFSVYTCLLTYAAIFGFYLYVVDAATIAFAAVVLACVAVALRGATFERSTFCAIALIAAVSIATGITQHETLLGDYDSGNYAFRAAYLGRTGDFAPMFLPGYTVFLSALFHTGGFALQQWGNAIILSATLLTLFHLGSLIGRSRWAGVAAIAIFASHYTTIWFSRQTLSDNMGVLLLFACLYIFLSGVDRRDAVRAAYSLVPGSLLLLCRAEGLLFLVTLSLALVVWAWRSRPAVPFAWRSIASAAVIVVIVAMNIGAVTAHETLAEGESYYLPYFQKAAHLTSAAAPFVPTVETSATPVNEQAGADALPTARDYTLRFVFDSFYRYGLHILLGVALLGLVMARRSLSLVVIASFVLSPVLLLVLEPTISWVHPWFMRHYWATLIPFIAVLAARGVVNLGDRRLGFCAAAILIALNLMQAREILVLRDSEGFHSAIADVNSLISDRDALVLAEPELKYVVDPLHYLYDVNAAENVSFVDVSRPERVERLLADADGTIYLISRRAPGEEFAGITLASERHFAPSSLEYVGGLSFRTRRLQFVASADRYARPENIPPKPLAEGYGPIAAAAAELPPRHVGTAEYRFYVYEVIGPSYMATSARTP